MKKLLCLGLFLLGFSESLLAQKGKDKEPTFYIYTYFSQHPKDNSENSQKWFEITRRSSEKKKSNLSNKWKIVDEEKRSHENTINAIYYRKKILWNEFVCKKQNHYKYSVEKEVSAQNLNFQHQH